MRLLPRPIPIKQILSKADFNFNCGLSIPTLHFRMPPGGTSTPSVAHVQYRFQSPPRRDERHQCCSAPLRQLSFRLLLGVEEPMVEA